MGRIFRKFRYLDYHVFIPYVLLSFIGLLMVYSASSYIGMTVYQNAEYFFIRQGIFITVGFVSFLTAFLLPMKFFKNKRMIMLAVFAIMASLVYLLIWGDEINGAKAWIDVGLPFNIQPAEFAKFLVIWYFAYMFSKKQQVILQDFKSAILKPAILVGLIIGLIFLQPDVGTAFIIFVIAVIMIFSSGLSPIVGLTFSGAGILSLSGLMWVIRYHRDWLFFMEDYQYNRFLAFWNPFELAQSTGMQLVNSYYALSRGGIFGVGLGESVQKTGYLPEPYTDFIISIIGEEVGLIGILLILSVFIYLVMRIYLIGIRCRSPFHSLICIGAATMMLVQGFINLGGVLGLMPITGVTFPFISYGGSSTILLSALIGFVMNAEVSEKRMREKKEAGYQQMVG